MNIVDILMAKAMLGGDSPAGGGNAIELVLTYDDQTNTITIPESWTEVRECFLDCDTFLVLNQPGVSGVWMVVDVYENNDTYYVATNSDFVTFETDSADNYPTYIFNPAP